MLKKTLHTVIAAIAVSTMCLPTAEAAKEDLILNFDSMSYDFVGWESLQPKSCYEYCGEYDPGEVNQIKYEQGTMKFGKKTVEAHRTLKYPWGRGGIAGTHAVCDSNHDSFVAIEASILLRGDNLDNRLTLATISPEESNDLTNPNASGWCFGDGFNKLVINYEIQGATGKWRCAYIEGQSIFHSSLSGRGAPEHPQQLDRPFPASFGFDSQDESRHSGTVVINRSTCY